MTVFTGRHRPHEVLVMIWSTASALLHFTTPPQPSALAVYPPWLGEVAYVLLGVGGAVGLIGLAWRRLIASLILERTSMIAIAAGTAIYAVAAFYVGGWRALVGGGLIACWAAACAWRARQITTDLRKVTTGGGR